MDKQLNISLKVSYDNIDTFRIKGPIHVNRDGDMVYIVWGNKSIGSIRYIGTNSRKDSGTGWCITGEISDALRIEDKGDKVFDDSLSRQIKRIIKFLCKNPLKLLFIMDKHFRYFYSDCNVSLKISGNYLTIGKSINQQGNVYLSKKFKSLEDLPIKVKEVSINTTGEEIHKDGNISWMYFQRYKDAIKSNSVSDGEKERKGKVRKRK